MTQYFSLDVKLAHWERLTSEQLRAKLAALMDIGHLVFETGFSDHVPDPPKVETRTVTVTSKVYVCSGCSREFGSKRSLQGHLNRGSHRIVVTR